MGVEKKGGKQPIVSFILLTILTAIVASTLAVHSTFQPAPPPSFLNERPTTSHINYSTTRQLIITPPPQFIRSGQAEKYDSKTLFEKINGKAPLYIDGGFVELVNQRLMHKNDMNQWFEVFVYNMGADANAFSLFSTQRRPDSTISSTLKAFDHYNTENGLYVRLGRYYIECIGSSTDVLLRKAMIQTVQAILAENLIETKPIAELGLFPKENLTPNSYKLYLANTFGSQVLTNTFLGSYTIDDIPVTAFISKQGDSAFQVAKGYKQFLIDSGATPAVAKDGRIQYLDLFGTIESIFQIGPYLAGVHEADNLKSAQVLSEQLLKRLQKETLP